MNKTLFIACGLMLGLSACEMKDELLNSSKLPDTKGTLALNVTANEPETLTRAVNTANFPVTIEGQGDVASVIYSYNSPAEMPASILMPVGTYTVAAHTPGTLERRMDAPYYEGSDDVVIMKNVTTRHEVVCKMANSRIRVVLADEFKAAFDTWTITINDGTDQALSYDETSSYADVFWHFINQTKIITVDVRAVTKDGNSIYATNAYSKSSCDEGYMDIENEYFTGGDAITLRFLPAANPNGTIDGISVTANVSFENYDETVDLEVKDNGADDDPNTNPGTPDDPNTGEGITVDFVYGQEFTVAYGQTADYPEVQLNFTFPTGLKNLYVKVSGSSEFELACGLMGLTDGDGLDLTSDAALELGELFNLPTVGDKTYTFALNETLWQLLACGPGYPGTQKFTLKAVDQNGKSQDGTLTIHINE